MKVMHVRHAYRMLAPYDRDDFSMDRFMRLMPAGHMVAVRRQQARRLCAVTLVMALSLFVASPFVTLWSVASAMQAHDVQTLGTYLNWRSVQTGLKAQIVTGLVGAQPAGDDDLPEFGSSFAAAAVSNAVDTNVNAANLGTLMDQLMPAGPSDAGKPAAGRPAPNHSVTGAARVRILRHVRVRFVRLNMFEASLALPDQARGHARDSKLHLQMQIQGWRWKITRIDLPSGQDGHPIIEAAVDRPAVVRTAVLAR